jgi:hypothetical protein
VKNLQWQEKNGQIVSIRSWIMANVGAIRPNTKNMKIAYRILRTPKQLQQDAHENKKREDKRRRQWSRDSSYSQ